MQRENKWQERFDELWTYATKHEIKALIQSEIDMAVAERDKAIIEKAYIVCNGDDDCIDTFTDIFNLIRKQQ